MKLIGPKVPVKIPVNLPVNILYELFVIKKLSLE